MPKLFVKHRKLLVFAMDMTIMACVAVILFIRSPMGNGTGDDHLWPLIVNLAVWFICVMVFNALFHTYDSLWRYAEGKEYLALLSGFVCGTILYLGCTNLFVKRQLSGLYMISVLGASLLVMLSVRFLYRAYRRGVKQKQRKAQLSVRKIGVIGMGNAGFSLLREIVGNEASPYEPIVIFDDDPMKIGTKVFDIPVKGPINKIPEYLENGAITDLFLAIPSLSGERRSEILKLGANTGCRLHILPDRVKSMATNAPLLSQIRNVRVEDLLGREAIQLDGVGTREMIHGKTVMVTGGGGSIGSELCRQIAAMSPKRLIILDVYENSTYELQQSLLRQYGSALDLKAEIATVQDAALISDLFKKYQPDLVFHAAAHKHVPLMEASPREAVKNNVFGTLNVVRAAHETGVARMLLISTDKAVNPTSIMGATKRLCEMILSSMQGRSKTEFVAVRFGNVLGSNGSVIPLFQRQIEEGGPVTITDRRIIRYFMTIPEAVSLVLEAGSMAKGSQVFVLDMGKPVSILTLAENLIRLSGYIPYQQIQIDEIGLRPGEKLFEELLVGTGNQRKTQNELIFVEDVQPVSPHYLEQILKDLRVAVESGDDANVFAVLHRYVPEFRTAAEANVRFVPPEEEQGSLQTEQVTFTPALATTAGHV